MKTPTGNAPLPPGAPFTTALRCTAAALLAVKTAIFPGQILDWNRTNSPISE